MARHAPESVSAYIFKRTCAGRQQRVRLVGDLPLYISCRMPCADHMADQAAT